MNQPRYSVIIPVYNRPNEVRDLLESFLTQTRTDFEIIVVEDGSINSCEDVVSEYSGKLAIRYYYKSNSGPGPSRNFGFVHARGQFFVVFDSDCILPPTYFESVDSGLISKPLDAWGGPDKAHSGFTIPQRAMGYTMSSILTTGGIRGGKQSLESFQPRSFNMGISKEVFQVTGGFKFDRYAEDIELSIRMKQAGFRIGLIPEAYVFHKRRATFLQFFKQVFNFGKGRALIGTVHPGEVKITHWFPACFTLGFLVLPILYLIKPIYFHLSLSLFMGYLVIIFIHSLRLNRNFAVACLSVPSALLQLWGYGAGFLMEKIKKGNGKSIIQGL